MNIICVDDEVVILNHIVNLCKSFLNGALIKGFSNAKGAIDEIENQNIDIAILDIDLPDMNGLTLAAKIKELSPETSIIFLTGHPRFATDAFKLHASGYLLKPVDKEELNAEIEYALSSKKTLPKGKVSIETFGNFEVYSNGVQLKFNMAKCKEILAYLVDRQGSSATRAEIASILWEDRIYDRKLQKQLDVYIRSLRSTLEEYGIANIIERKRGTLRVVPEEFECDAYLFFKGDAKAVNAFRGEYMSAYSWASITEGIMFSKMNK